MFRQVLVLQQIKLLFVELIWLIFSGVFFRQPSQIFTPSDSERIECLTARRVLNAFCEKIERIVIKAFN